MTKPTIKKKRAARRSSNRAIVGTSVAVGIGSAAIAAALLYATRPRKTSAAEHGPGLHDGIEDRFVDET